MRFIIRLLIGVILLQPGLLPAEPVAVRHIEGTVHGFLALRTMEGKILGAGDLIQVLRGDQVVSRLVFRFRDGSVDDETAIFTQRGSLRLVSDHHIQKGPAFPHPTDVVIMASTRQVTVRYTDDDGHQKVEMDRLDLPPDLANGIVLNILKNIRPETSETKVSYVAATPKPRLVKLSIVPQGEETFLVAGSGRKAMRFTLKVELGGITGAVASLLGKQPANTNVWVVGGEAPTFVKLEGPLYLGGPIWSIELTSPVWQESPQKKAPDNPQKK
ncbi:MAG: hypothetical protein JWO19_390 [Bryobacterales bacterium]|nr:hypothetical protein [Bryobacterales bacterium]